MLLFSALARWAREDVHWCGCECRHFFSLVPIRARCSGLGNGAGQRDVSGIWWLLLRRLCFWHPGPGVGVRYPKGRSVQSSGPAAPSGAVSAVSQWPPLAVLFQQHGCVHWRGRRETGRKANGSGSSVRVQTLLLWFRLRWGTMLQALWAVTPPCGLWGTRSAASLGGLASSAVGGGRSSGIGGLVSVREGGRGVLDLLGGSTLFWAVVCSLEWYIMRCKVVCHGTPLCDGLAFA